MLRIELRVDMLVNLLINANFYTGTLSDASTAGNMSESITSSAHFNIFWTVLLFRHECNCKTIHREIGGGASVYLIETITWNGKMSISFVT